MTASRSSCFISVSRLIQENACSRRAVFQLERITTSFYGSLNFLTEQVGTALRNNRPVSSGEHLFSLRRTKVPCGRDSLYREGKGIIPTSMVRLGSLMAKVN